MKIASSDIQMQARHHLTQVSERSESLRRGQNGPRLSVANPTVSDPVTLSPAGQEAAARAADEQTLNDDPRTSLIRLMIEALTGKKLKLFDPESLQSANSDGSVANTATAAVSGSGFTLEQRTHLEIHERSSFSASGTVLTADGQRIDFSLTLTVARDYVEDTAFSLIAGGDQRKVDPLVLNFAGNAASLNDQRFDFDLNADGDNESIASLSRGSAYLVFDRNGDGRVNSGAELFGPQSSDGFAELAALDEDHNGWIDENDNAFSQLRLWQGAAGTSLSSLQTLSSAGVGAIALQRIATPFQLTDHANGTLGEIRTSGIFLHEDGTTGTIQQIDLSA